MFFNVSDSNNFDLLKLLSELTINVYDQKFRMDFKVQCYNLAKLFPLIVWPKVTC